MPAETGVPAARTVRGGEADVLIGSGHNALVAAYYLAKAGRNPIVLERRAEVGGGAVTGEIAPGFLCPTLTHEVLLQARVVRDLQLDRHAVELLAPAAEVCALDPEGPPLVLGGDVSRAADRPTRLSPKDAAAFPAFQAAIRRMASVLASTFVQPAPGIDRLGTGDLWQLLKTGRTFRALGSRAGYRLLRWLPMPIADVAAEWFDDELLRATIAGPGVSGTMLGPRSAGSTLVMLLREAHRGLAYRRTIRARGGPGAVTRALASAALAAGAVIRTGAAVERILVKDGRVVGVVSRGDEIATTTVISGVDPRRTFLDLLEPNVLEPEFAARMRNFRAQGTVAKLNLALSALPAFRHVGPDTGLLSGRIHIGPSLDYVERAFDCAKYGEPSTDPWLDLTIPSILDPDLAPRGAHVASAYVHYAPYRLADPSWDRARGLLQKAAVDVLERYAPGIREHIVAADLITPDRLESEYGFSGGHIFHGELAPDQLYSFRPQLGCERYGTPITGLFLCGGGTHPGGFMTGASGRLAAREVLRALKS